MAAGYGRRDGLGRKMTRSGQLPSMLGGGYLRERGGRAGRTPLPPRYRQRREQAGSLHRRRFPALPQRGLQLPVVHDPVQHGRQSGARQGCSKRDIRPVRAADDLGQDTPDSEPAGNPCQTSTPPREIGALVRERRPVDLAACQLRRPSEACPRAGSGGLAAARAPRSDCRSAGGHRHATLPIFGRPGDRRLSAAGRPSR